MKTMLLSAVLAAALPSAVLASPTLLTDHEMAQIAAGSTVSLLLADGGVVNVAVNGSNLQITGDAAALKMTSLVVNGMVIDLQGKPLSLTIPASAPVAFTVNSPNAATSAQVPSSGVSVNVSTAGQPSNATFISSTVSGSGTVTSNVTSTSSIHLTTSSSVMISR